MTTYKIKIFFLLIAATFLFVQCVDDDDNGNALIPDTCNDGIQNGGEEGIDCGGNYCPACDEESGVNFDGIFEQVDIAGRPAVNMLFGGSDSYKNDYNVTIVSDRNIYQSIFENTLENYYEMYAVALEIPVDEFNYETNILGWNAQTFTSIMSKYDALQVAPNGLTSYYDADNNLVFTGRKLSDDVMDTTLMLLFGGETGTRLDGTNDTPQLTTDGVDLGNHDFPQTFPYLEDPIAE